MAKILLKFKDAVLKEFNLEKDVLTIGRKPTNDIHVDNLAVSGTHARIFKKDDKFYIEDLNSLNGTFVNGKKISVHHLTNTDVVIIGKHSLNYISDKETPKPKVEKEASIMDETIMIDSKLKDEILQKSPAKDSTPDKAITGGFVVIEGSTEKNDYELLDRITTIGKDKSAVIHLKGLFAPKVAALVNKRKDGYTISSATGGKGVKVNGKDIDSAHKLEEGDIVEVGGLKMQFYIKES
ncbi:MAG: FHA domain-containing protein [Candidatus Magnetobacterium sp. LHC-1]|uniref:FHA domain-containing protein n=1 Tax=Candidatus Magnetobacterium casense TaxID=1455061 RepID=A0ABS6RZJ2_9BACT|nr:FHA domain-containing protein [Candidatus Magnetobacterium casensis]MBF0607901.1 FHA domain-containing protein [Nitrospirota bacterium]MBV6341193.1 FHA domain-containing protein [Candidatus Magnetobacterium casensis]